MTAVDAYIIEKVVGFFLFVCLFVFGFEQEGELGEDGEGNTLRPDININRDDFQVAFHVLSFSLSAFKSSDR